MQLDKGIKELAEIEKYAQDNSSLIGTYNRILSHFNLWGVSHMLLHVKERGISSTHLFKTLVVLTFLQIDNVYNLFLSDLRKEVVGSKNTYYRFMKNEWVPWRKVLYAFARQFMKRTAERCKSSTSGPSCIIFDDTTLEKSGKKIEFTGKVYRHNDKSYVHGYKGLFCGYWDGRSYLPLDFSLHQEPGTDGKCGLKKKELDAQYKKERSPHSHGYQRQAELRENKIHNCVRMTKRTLKNGFDCDYVLADSWFISEPFITQIRSLNNKGKAPHVLGIMKSNRKVKIGERSYYLKTLPQTHLSQRHNCKRFGCTYITLGVNYKGINLKIFLIQMKGQDNWRILVTTDLSLSFTKAMEIYAIRWTIEVSFKDMKQHLQLGQHQSVDFDAQIAATTLSCIRYIILAFARRHEDYESISGMFQLMKQSLLQAHLLQRIIKLLETIYTEVVACLGVHFDYFMDAIINSDKILRCLEVALTLVSSFKIKNPPLNFNF